MNQPSAMAFLESLWSGIDLNELKCCQCGHKIGSDAVLARTFTLQSQSVTDERLYSERVEVPTLSEVLLIYHRHLECLFKSTQFVAISHVWHPLVAQIQYKRTEAAACADDAARIIREDPVRICHGLMTKLMGHFDIWHDYISVPQWQPSLKSQIIQSIPKIFKQAELTVAHLSDVDPQNVKAMQEGDSVYDRCRGISNICNAKWFSRVWTAMEHTQSRELRAMFKDYTLVDDLDVQPPVVYELGRAWGVEIRKQGNALDTEQMVGMGNNLVPWQLGSLELVRSQNLQGIRTIFATAHELLARRCVTIPRDFFHALLGILKPNLTESQLSTDRKEAMLQIARSCMAEGDYSPLFMIPSWALVEPNDVDIRRYGYLDLVTFAMGPEIMPPTFRDIRFRSGNPIIQAENIGVVQYVRRISGNPGTLSTASILLRLTLESTGPDVDAFVKTIGGRLYGQDPDKIFERLSEGDRMCGLRDKLSALYDSCPEDPDGITSWIAEAMGLSNTSLECPVSVGLSPMRFLEAHGGTLHLGSCGVVVSVNCPRCHKAFLLRVALLKPELHVIGVRGYRVPGLKYEFTHAGGAGFLLKNGRIVGRFIWGTPTCACSKLEEVEVLLDDLPLPRPNHTNYGQQTDKTWYPVSQVKIAT
jgi:hypothetical protein